MEKKVEVSILCELYGKLLTDKQFIFMDDYYNNDLSLSEIAENNGITRQAVRDIIGKTEKRLYDIENKLGFMNKNEKLEKEIKNIITIIDNSKDDRKTMEEIKKRLNVLI